MLEIMSRKKFIIFLSTVSIIVVCTIGGFYLYVWSFNQYKRCVWGLEEGVGEPLVIIDWNAPKEENSQILKRHQEELKKACIEKHPIGSRLKITY